MFSIQCPRHQARVLLGLDAITALVPTPEGIEVHWRCTCGQTGVWLTGSGRRRTAGSALGA